MVLHILHVSAFAVLVLLTTATKTHVLCSTISTIFVKFLHFVQIFIHMDHIKFN